MLSSKKLKTLERNIIVKNIDKYNSLKKKNCFVSTANCIKEIFYTILIAFEIMSSSRFMIK